MKILSRWHRGQLSTILALGAVVALAVAIVNGTFSGATGHNIQAQFVDAQSITKGNTVHLDGVTAGTVTKIELKHNVAVLTLHLDDKFWPLHTDAAATVRPISLLGENYVDLQPGTPSKPLLPDGATLTPAHTTNAVNLQTVLNALSDPTSTAFGVVLTSLAQGVAGQGANSSASLKALAPALDSTTSLVQLLDRQNQTLVSLLDQLTPVTSALATNQGQTLDHLVTTSGNTLRATAAQSNSLGADLRILPPFLNTTTAAFNQLGVLADQVTPALASLTPLTNNLTAVSNEIINFSNAADPAVASLRPVIDQVGNLSTQIGPVVNTLRTAGPAMQTDSAALIPIVQQGITGTCTNNSCQGLDNIFGFVRNWALATQNYDGLSHYFRFFVNLSPQNVAGVPGLNTLLPTGTPKVAGASVPASQSPSLLPSTGPLAAPVNGLTTTIGGTINNLLGPTAGANSSPSSSSATGLTPSQEQNLFSYLLGGS